MLINIRGNKKATTPADIQEYCATAGLKLIKLIHSTEFGRNIRVLIGFQSAEILAGEVDGKKRFKFKLEDAGLRQAEFIPEGLTGLLVALVPDTAYNRKKMADVYFAPRQAYRIEDATIDAEIKAVATTLEANRPKKKTDKELLAETAKALEEANKKLAVKDKSDELSVEVTEALTDSATPKRKAGRPKKILHKVS